MISDFLMLGKAIKESIDVVKDTAPAAKKGSPEAMRVLMEEGLRKQALLSSNGSMAKFLKRYIVEPTIYITPSAARSEEIHDVINRQLDIFASFYIQVFQILLQSYDLHAETAVTVLNTGGGEREALIKYGPEIIAKGLNTANNLISNLDFGIDSLVNEFMNNKYMVNFSTEDRKELVEDINKSLIKSSIKKKLEDNIKVKDEKSTIGYDFYIRELDINLSRVTTGEVNNKKYETDLSLKIPLTIRASVVTINTDELILAYKPNNNETSFFSRLEQYRSGRISMKEFIFCTDLIKARKEQKLRDVNDMINKLEKNVSSANSKYLTTGFVGFEKYYNMFILSIDDVKKIKSIINVDILNTVAKENFLSKLNGFSAMVIDQEWERVSLMIKDLGDVTSVPLKKVKSKNKTEDLTSLYKQILLGQTPRF